MTSNSVDFIAMSNNSIQTTKATAYVAATAAFTDGHMVNQLF
jgi:hypothetical protein